MDVQNFHLPKDVLFFEISKGVFEENNIIFGNKYLKFYLFIWLDNVTVSTDEM